MKKLLILLLLFSLCIFFSACRDNGDDDKSIEKSIDAIAEYLEFTGGQTILAPEESVPGAIAGKEFNNGSILIYQFNPNSFEYEELENQMAISKEGFVIMIDEGEGFSMETRDMEALLKKFEEIKFE